MGLRWRIVTVLLVASLAPLGLLGIGSWVVSARMIADKSLEVHRALVESHAGRIDMYLVERLRALDLASRSLHLESGADRGMLVEMLDALNATHDRAFVDLGIIDQDGRHLAYVGPFALQDRNYAGEPWFREVMIHGSYVSDVFLGFREVPHFVIAVKRRDEGRSWILRATIDSDDFNSLVQTDALGETGNVVIVNAAGYYQTPPRAGRVLDRSPFPVPQRHTGVSHERVVDGAETSLRSMAWLNGGRWMLVVHQAESEVRAPVVRAAVVGSAFVLTAVVLVIAVTFIATWHLGSLIDRANAQRDTLYRDWLRSAKLASLGELATGLAHEINNPLQIISTEQTNISDALDGMETVTPGCGEMRDSVARIRRQVDRCAEITSKMLQFGRDGSTATKPTPVAPGLGEVVRLMGRQARLQDVDLQLEIDDDLPDLELNPTELEQVLVNLINNSLQACRRGGSVLVSAFRNGHDVRIEVADDGAGIEPENIDRIFQPFFTTKPPGQGTGLGLAVCHGIVQGWGGTMQAESEPGKGTTISIRLPVSGKSARPK